MRAALVIAVLATSQAAFSHDAREPSLDQWYGSLVRPGVKAPFFTSCCSKTDCHTTEAELRGDDWWARVGIRMPNGDWDLRDWVKVPTNVVLLNKGNPTGEGVICHSQAWGMSLPGQQQPFNAAGVTIWCFVPQTES